MNENEKIYFLPGDVVTLRQRLSNKPNMLVVRKVMKKISTPSISGDHFQGMLCRWFTTDGTLQEATFNTKDLIKL